MHDERLEFLLAISRRTLGIESFELTGKPTADVHLVSAEDIGRALESAYDAGLIVGYRMGRAECEQNT
ncbi:DUF6900 domain-containing protein [Paraburkholderia silvatlantica]|uniref:DUF6900 domain-containing protein n=1 Tax=Paraburkholderia silvatlantica TaxID=321895 RepID=A0ABR6FEX5_9BURK|nr:hypothetical protein [Paraburkholderia silvatlantica]MBB2925984.1 hypothetical protein [Paraburkholderia silvatlantica]PVY33517.1 hypothetical protein C7411_108171 [Paraburkholderia silvatlantica]PXW38457.1 hypothetical protein C7413_108171 [Paraburkholderia silvatlantica]TDQ92909.1 hypothetical protein C7412_110171 [Paraburkholderia silvatlantica]